MGEAVILGAERLGGRAPKAWAWYEHGNVSYVVPWIGDIEDIEELAELLAELVERHVPGHGERAFKAAIEQLQSTDFVGEYLKMERQIKAFQRWGGHPPAAVLQPDELDPKAPWNLVVPTEDGLGPIQVWKVKPEVTRELPRPQEGVNAYRDEWGWKAIPPKQEVERRRRNRAHLDAIYRGLRERRVRL